MANFVKAIREKGIVISKELIEAREAGESLMGQENGISVMKNISLK